MLLAACVLCVWHTVSAQVPCARDCNWFFGFRAGLSFSGDTVQPLDSIALGSDEACAAISVGIVDAVAHLDLDYSEDVRAEVDMNVVMTASGKFVEVQGTAEGLPFSRSELDDLLGLAEHGIAQILERQAELLATPPPARKLTSA